MVTVSKALADEIIDRNGYYFDDPRVLRIVEYTNAWDGVSYGLEYQGHLGKYSESQYVRNPRIYWQAPL